MSDAGRKRRSAPDSWQISGIGFFSYALDRGKCESSPLSFLTCHVLKQGVVGGSDDFYRSGLLYGSWCKDLFSTGHKNPPGLLLALVPIQGNEYYVDGNGNITDNHGASYNTERTANAPKSDVIGMESNGSGRPVAIMQDEDGNFRLEVIDFSVLPIHMIAFRRGLMIF